MRAESGCFFFQAEDGIRDLVRSRGLGDVYKRQAKGGVDPYAAKGVAPGGAVAVGAAVMAQHPSNQQLSLIHI